MSVSAQQFESVLLQILPEFFRRQGGFQVERDRELYGGYKPDFVLIAGGRTIAVEAKLTAKEAMDFMARAYNLVRQPGLNEAMVILPATARDSDVETFALQTGVGLAILDMTSKQMALLRWGAALNPSFSLALSYPQRIRRGEQFQVSVGVNNNGPKALAKVDISYLAAYPFEPPQEKSNSASVELVQPSTRVDVNLPVRAKPDSTPGIYPLIIKVESVGVVPQSNRVEIRVD